MAEDKGRKSFCSGFVAGGGELVRCFGYGGWIDPAFDGQHMGGRRYRPPSPPGSMLR
jgi:hypothetical protein